jgi:hypothetical protein
LNGVDFFCGQEALCEKENICRIREYQLLAARSKKTFSGLERWEKGLLLLILQYMSNVWSGTCNGGISCR